MHHFIQDIFYFSHSSLQTSTGMKMLELIQYNWLVEWEKRKQHLFDDMLDHVIWQHDQKWSYFSPTFCLCIGNRAEADSRWTWEANNQLQHPATQAESASWPNPGWNHGYVYAYYMCVHHSSIWDCLIVRCRNCIESLLSASVKVIFCMCTDYYKTVLKDREKRNKERIKHQPQSLNEVQL